MFGRKPHVLKHSCWYYSFKTIFHATFMLLSKFPCQCVYIRSKLSIKQRQFQSQHGEILAQKEEKHHQDLIIHWNHIFKMRLVNVVHDPRKQVLPNQPQSVHKLTDFHQALSSSFFAFKSLSSKAPCKALLCLHVYMGLEQGTFYTINLFEIKCMYIFCLFWLITFIY